MYYLAVDIGASGGRHILGSIENGKIITEEVYRFTNGVVKKNGHLCWDGERLFEEIKTGMKKCAELGKNPVSMGIDCFAVDFALLDKDNNLIGDTVSYRDGRTTGLKASGVLPQDKIRKITGMNGGDIHSVFQLISVKNSSDDLSRAERFLHLPDYFHFLLTGVDVNEYANSQSSLLINTETEDFDKELIELAGIPAHIFKKPVKPMTVIGRLKPEIVKETGIDCQVALPATHDTISAAMAVPSGDDTIFISSGTWSLVGAFLKKEHLADEGFDAGFANMYIDKGRIGYIKGITGLWMIQSIKRELDNKYSYGDLCDMAEKSDYTYTVDVDEDCFTAPDSMLEAIKGALERSGAPAPEGLGDIVNCVYHSLSIKYAQAVEEIEKILGRKYDKINIVGGGSKDDHLNKLTAIRTGKEIYAGPSEATAIGNLMAQMVATGRFASLDEAKTVLEKPRHFQK